MYRKFNDDRETISSGPPPANPNSRKSKIDVFGQELSEVCRETDKQVPEIVTFSIKKIEAIGITDGIYRISGKLASYYLKWNISSIYDFHSLNVSEQVAPSGVQKSNQHENKINTYILSLKYLERRIRGW